MTLCHASNIIFDGRMLSWFGPDGATWSIPVERLRAIRELIADSGDVRWFVEFAVDGDDVWLRSPGNAGGMSQALTALGKQLNATLEAQGNSRVVWSRSELAE